MSGYWFENSRLSLWNRPGFGLGLILCLLWAQAALAAATPYLPQPAPNFLRVYDIYNPLKKGQWQEALNAAQDNDAATALIHWKRARDHDVTLTIPESEQLVEQFKTWPRYDQIFINIERALSKNPNDIEVLDWFMRYPAVSGLGKIRHGEALLSKAFVTEGTNAIRTGWVEATLSRSETRTLYRKHKKQLRTQDHEARADRLLWARQWSAAHAMSPYVSKGWQALIQARTALHKRSGNVDFLIRQVPKALQKHPGLLYERARWRRLAGLHDGARDILLTMKEHTLPDTIARKVWVERRFQVREALDANAPKLAYDLALQHGAIGGSAFAEGEWLSGWIALRYLNQPQRAQQHFMEMWNGVGFPISRSRAAYWAGRASLTLNEPAQAHHWFKLAARYHRTFYGQLAMLQLYEKPTMPNPVVYTTDPETQQKVKNTLLARAATIAHWLGWKADSRALVRHLDEELSTSLPEAHRAIFDVAGTISGRFAQLQLAKRAIRRGHAFDDVLFPTLRMPAKAHLPADITHAIIRQESMFNAEISSHAGARGLMQLMPGTARLEARKQKVRLSQMDQLYNPDLNIVLGTSYLKGLIDRYDGSYILAIAAYNAGPSRVKRWLAFYGDPRTDAIDPLDWLERIPFSETRNYVQRIMENLQVYRAFLDQNAGLQLREDLKRGAKTKLTILYDTNILKPSASGGP